MRAFRSGKRDFVKDEIVFVVDKLDNFMDILIGKINTYAGYGKYYVDLYTVTEKKEDIDPNHILLIYLMSGRKSTLKNTRKTKIKQSKSYLTYGFLNRSYIITKK